MFFLVEYIKWQEKKKKLISSPCGISVFSLKPHHQHLNFIIR